MNAEELKRRTRDFGLRVIRLVESLPKNRTCDVIGRQLLRAGPGVGANYRAACRARSVPDFVSKMSVVEEEADEAAYWMEVLVDAGAVKASALAPLRKEADELVSIAVSSINTARGKRREGRRAEENSD